MESLPRRSGGGVAIMSVVRAVRICSRSVVVLIRFPLRTLLVMLSAMLGVAGALCSVNYALGGREKLLDQFEKLGANVLIVTPQQSRPIAGRARTGTIVQTLVPADVRAIQIANLPIVRASATFSRAFLIKAGDLAKNNTPVIGVEPAFFAIKHWGVMDGELFTAEQERRGARVALLGSTIARELFNRSPVGMRVLVNRVPFDIIGVLAERGQGLDASNEDTQVYVPLRTAMQRLANADYFSSVLFELARPDDLVNTGQQIRSILHKRHRQFAKLPEDFDVQNQRRLIDTQMAVSSKMYSFARWIGFCALLVGGLGALSISWIAVRERTNEIGTRRALGATRFDVFVQIAFEAMLPAGFGTTSGVVVARHAVDVLANIAAQPRVFDEQVAIIACALSIAINTIFSALPARAAARLDPMQALHFE